MSLDIGVPSWAASPEPVAPAWAATASDATAVPLSELLHRSGRSDSSAPAGRVFTEEQLSALLDGARAEGAATARSSVDAAILAALASLPIAIEDALAAHQGQLVEAVSHGSAVVMEAALAVASWLCQREVQSDPQLLLTLAEQALKEAGGTAEAAVHVPSSLAQAAQSWAARLGTAAPAIVPDDTVPAGQVQLRRGDAAAEVSVPAALARAAHALGVTAPSVDA